MDGIAQFLAKSRIAIVATRGSTGKPHLIPCWYLFDSGVFRVSTTTERTWVRNVERDSLLSVCVYEEPGAPRYAMLSGSARIIHGDSIWPDTEKIVERYIPSERVKAMMAKFRKQPRVIVELKPEQGYIREMSWAPRR